MGADPWVIAPLAGAKDRFVGLLRGRDAVVLLDGALHELSRASTPESPSGLAVAPSGDVLVVSDLRPILSGYRVDKDTLVPAFGATLRADAPRDIAVGDDGVAYVIDARADTLLVLSTDGSELSRVPTCRAPIRVARAGRAVLVDCLVDHRVDVLALGADGAPSGRGAHITHDGPIWSLDARAEADGHLTVALGGIEDHRLDRTGGSFGFIDSFAFVYDVDPIAEKAEQRASINVSESGVVTPKALHFKGDSLFVAGFGSGGLLELAWNGAPHGAPARTQLHPSPPGVASFAFAGARVVCANPLIDAWGALEAERSTSVPVANETAVRARDERVGEAMIFTTEMAPFNSSAGALSRFTCEACHFEGTIDGRTHATGRGAIVATTKPLTGLFDNRPHFSRAHDANLTDVAYSEFIVANANSGHAPWFTRKVADAPWLAELGVDRDLDAEDLRRGFLAFLMAFRPRPNARATGRSAFRAIEKKGASLFASRCAGCHAPLPTADAKDAARAPTETWEGLIFQREAPLVWGSAAMYKTGVEPYVDPRGARVPSLRRVTGKRPYFTNGSAKDLDALLSRAWWRAGHDGELDAFQHDRGSNEPSDPEATRLLPGQASAIRAFLELL
jgi:hypothetical protein